MTETEAQRRDTLAADLQKCWQIIAELRNALVNATHGGLSGEELDAVRELLERSRKI